MPQSTVTEAITNLLHSSVIHKMAVSEWQDGEQKGFDTGCRERGENRYQRVRRQGPLGYTLNGQCGQSPLCTAMPSNTLARDWLREIALVCVVRHRRRNKD